MKLFALPDGTVDRNDRAQWLTPPFDLSTFSLTPGSGIRVDARTRATVTTEERRTLKARKRAEVEPDKGP